MKPSSSVTNIPCNLKRFFKYWLQFTEPLHKLSKQDMEFLAVLLYKRYELSKIIKDDAFLDKYLLSKDMRESLLEETGIKNTYFRVVLSNFRDKKVLLEDGTLNKRFVPNLTEDNKTFNLMIIFDIKEDGSIKATQTNTSTGSPENEPTIGGSDTGLQE